MLDGCGRQIDYVRISITDRCNLRCVYCMPEEGVARLRHEDILSFEEIERVARALSRLGIRYIRITGGEPMARRGCLDLVARLHAILGIEEIAITTNGLLLDSKVREAKNAGLTALNISVDTLDPENYRRMTRGGTAREGERCARARAERLRTDGACRAGAGSRALSPFHRADARRLWRSTFTDPL